MNPDGRQLPGWWRAGDGWWYPPALDACEPAGVYTDLPPDLVAQQLALALATRGAILTEQTATTIAGTVARRNRLNGCFVLVLLLGCGVLLPVYLITARRRRIEPFAVWWTSDGTGSRVWGRGRGGGLTVAWQAVDSLPR